jgi:hypothetical protein
VERVSKVRREGEQMVEGGDERLQRESFELEEGQGDREGL